MDISIWKFKLGAVFALIAILGLQLYELNIPPVGLNVIEIALIAMIYTILINEARSNSYPKVRYSIKSQIGIAITIFIFIVASSAGTPAPKSYAGAQNFTSDQNRAITIGKYAANSVTAPNSLTTEAEQIQILQNSPSLSQENKELAIEILQGQINNPLTDKQIVEKYAPKVPVVLGEWTCTEVGCSYADEARIWTIHNSTRVMKAIVVSIILLVLSWQIFTPDLKNNDEN